MKTLLTIIIGLAALSASAQSTTNLAFRVTIEVVTAGVTNSTQSTVRLDDSVKREKFLIAGAIYAYSKSGSTNSFEAWLKTDIKDRLAEYARVKGAADSADTAAKITTLLTTNPDLLTVGDLANLATIAAKAP